MKKQVSRQIEIRSTLTLNLKAAESYSLGPIQLVECSTNNALTSLINDIKNCGNVTRIECAVMRQGVVEYGGFSIGIDKGIVRLGKLEFVVSSAYKCSSTSNVKYSVNLLATVTVTEEVDVSPASILVLDICDWLLTGKQLPEGIR